MDWFESAKKSLEEAKAREAVAKEMLAPSLKVLGGARHEAVRLNHNYVGAEHFLLALMRSNTGVSIQALKTSGADLEAIRLGLEGGNPTPGSGKNDGPIPYTPRMKRIIELAMNEAKSLGHARVEPDHLFLGLLQENNSFPAQIFWRLKVDRVKIRKEILEELKRRPDAMS